MSRTLATHARYHFCTMPRRSSLPIILALATLPACRKSLWEQSLTRVDAAPAARTLPTDIRVRDVPWERVEPVLAQLRADVAQSDAPVDEWPAEQRADAERTLLRALQVTPQSGVTQILASSEFRTTDFSRPDQDELRTLAASLGATLVVWSSRPLGKADRLDYVPVTTWTSGTIWARRDKHGRTRSEPYNESSTTWAPVVTQADESAFLAFFLR